MDKALSQTQWSEFLSDLRRTASMTPNELFARSARNLIATSLMRLVQEDTTDLTWLHRLIKVEPKPLGMLTTLTLPTAWAATRDVQLRVCEEFEHSRGETVGTDVVITFAKYVLPEAADA